MSITAEQDREDFSTCTGGENLGTGVAQAQIFLVLIQRILLYTTDALSHTSSPGSYCPDHTVNAHARISHTMTVGILLDTI